MAGGATGRGVCVVTATPVRRSRGLTQVDVRRRVRESRRAEGVADTIQSPEPYALVAELVLLKVRRKGAQ